MFGIKGNTLWADLDLMREMVVDSPELMLLPMLVQLLETSLAVVDIVVKLVGEDVVRVANHCLKEDYVATLDVHLQSEEVWKQFVLKTNPIPVVNVVPIHNRNQLDVVHKRMVTGEVHDQVLYYLAWKESQLHQ